MGFLRNIIWGRKKQYREEITDEEEQSVQSRVVSLQDPISRSNYVDNCIEQIEDAQAAIDELTKEYDLVTTYLHDMEEIEALPVESKEEISEIAGTIVKLTNSKDSLEERADRMRDSDYARMCRMEDEIVEGIEKLKDAEDYQTKIRQDLRRLDGERQACEMRIRQCRHMIENTRGMAVICLVAVVLCILMLVVLQFGFELETKPGYLITAAAAAIAITYIYLKHTDAKEESRKNARMMNKLILLQNKVKIRYVNNSNLLDYLKLKYGVERSDTLKGLWNQYSREKELRHAQKEAEDELNICKQELLRVLRRYQIRVPEVWPGQAMALVNKKEMVEVRHTLIGRRQSLRKQLEYNSNLATRAQEIIKEVVRDYPQDAKDIMQKVSQKM